MEIEITSSTILWSRKGDFLTIFRLAQIWLTAGRVMERKTKKNRRLWQSWMEERDEDRELMKSALEDIVSDELKKLKKEKSGGEGDMLWEYNGIHTADQEECEEILLEMQKIFYEDDILEMNQREAENRSVLEDEEDEYLASAIQEYMQLNDEKGWKEKTWCPICWKGELKENLHFIYCSLCLLKINRGDEVNLVLLRDRLAEAHEEHLDRGCRSVFGLITFISLSFQYAKAGIGLWSFLLSAYNPSSWIAIAFSTKNEMVGSSAMVGWMYLNGTGKVLQYDLQGKDSNSVLPDKGNLTVIVNSSALFMQSNRMYMAFQLSTPQPLTNLLYALGPPSTLPIDNNGLKLSLHRRLSHTQVSPFTGLRKTHGALNMIGWGILMPIGAIVA
ncbi:hypothetical protein KSS87_012635, partial [Heliosperma pusillum]